MANTKLETTGLRHTKNMRALIDADMILYRAAFAAETETRWEDDIFTLHSTFPDLKDAFVDLIDSIEDELNPDSIELCFSSRVTFRHTMYPLYKANRADKRSPLGINDLREWASKEWLTHVWPELEADDVLGILGTEDPNTCIVSGDKDMGTLPVTWFNFLKGDTIAVTKEQAQFFHATQILSGDATDGYPGLKGFGPKTSQKTLAKHGVSWEVIVDLYEKQGMTEDDALMTARLAYILQDKDYNRETGRVRMWTPDMLENQPPE